MASPEAPLRYVGVDRSSAAFRLMKQMGWEEGEGLGKEKQGIKGYVRVKNKQDTSGIGTEKPNAWAFDTSQFDNILKKLKVQAVDINMDRADQKDGQEEDAKLSPSKDNKDCVVKVTRPQGRYKRREKGKLVNAYSSQDLEGILVNRAKSPEANHAVEVSEEEKLIEIHLPDMEDKVQDVPPEWWGHKFGFVTGGLLGAEARRKKALLSGIDQNPNGRTTFNEDDQENLYKLVQSLMSFWNVAYSAECPVGSRMGLGMALSVEVFLGVGALDKATSGKQGLGIKDRTKKVAGCYFQGKKTAFGDSDGEDSSDSRSSVKRKHEECSEMERSGSKTKLKKLCRQLLQQVPGESLKLKQLKVLVDEHSPSTFPNFSSEEALTFLKNKLENSDRFSVKGKKVSLSKRS
ncbi:hypothetical protein DH2020_028848 [Rehmannia glutinosa]|uniref:G-patch domain-containing protein n=1 Tax=Rehmannia glutinosa TaxID=99300 RepID=A0ABR0VUI4_REHGL